MTHHMHHSSSAAGAGAALAFLAGVGAGIAAGILFAPRKGQDTRDQLKDKVRQARQKAITNLDTAKEDIHTRVDMLRDQAEDSIEEGQAAMGDIRNEFAKQAATRFAKTKG